MKIDEIKELIQALEQSQLTSLEVSQGNDRLRLEKNYAAVQSAPVTAAPMQQPVAQPVMQAAPQESVAPVSAPQPKGTAVKSPIVGVFYAAPSPEDAPYVTVGSQVKKGDVLCLVEAMKLMNEITAEQDGVITEICVENAEVVEYGQPLFYLA